MNRPTTQALTAIIFFTSCLTLNIIAFTRVASGELGITQILFLAGMLILLWIISRGIAWALDSYRDALDNEYTDHEGADTEDDRKDWW